MFRSFFQGGFEGSSHRRTDLRQLDIIAASGHDVNAAGFTQPDRPMSAIGG